MSVITAFFYIIGVGLCIAFMQTNSIAQALTGVSNIDPIYVGIVVTIIAAIVTIGGVKRLTDISSKIVPVMAGLYILAVKLDLHVVLGIIDVFVGIIVFISVISLFLLFRKVQEVMDDYEKQKRDGIEDPIWERNEEYKL